MARTRSAAGTATKSPSNKASGVKLTPTKRPKRVVLKPKEEKQDPILSQLDSSINSSLDPPSDSSFDSQLNSSKPNTKSSSASHKKVKPHIETYYSHIEIPSDLSLPNEFVQSHTPEFIDGVKHILSLDRSLYPAIIHDKFRVFNLSQEPIKAENDLINYYYNSLIRSILGQQISGHAAKAIEGRFKLLFEGDPTPQKTLELLPEILKGVGLSSMKLKYILHISETFAKGDSNLSHPEFYTNASTDELIKELTLLKGIGEWSARMFCLFTLKHIDVFAYDDLGVARGVARYLEVRPELLAEVKKGVQAVEELKARLKRKGKFENANSKRDWKPLHDEYVKFLALKFLPYQLVFMLLMWRLSDTNTEVLQK